MIKKKKKNDLEQLDDLVPSVQTKQVEGRQCSAARLFSFLPTLTKMVKQSWDYSGHSVLTIYSRETEWKSLRRHQRRTD